jgi:hypothetical protein
MREILLQGHILSTQAGMALRLPGSRENQNEKCWVFFYSEYVFDHWSRSKNAPQLHARQHVQHTVDRSIDLSSIVFST